MATKGKQRWKRRDRRKAKMTGWKREGRGLMSGTRFGHGGGIGNKGQAIITKRTGRGKTGSVAKPKKPQVPFCPFTDLLTAQV